QPFALWQNNRKVVLVDTEGMTLAEDNLAAWKNLPMVVGEGANIHAASFLHLLSAQRDVMDMTASAVYVGARRWDLHLQNGIIVRLPEKDAGFALARLSRAEREKSLLGKNIKTLDLRQPDRMVLRLAAGATETVGDG